MHGNYSSYKFMSFMIVITITDCIFLMNFKKKIRAARKVSILTQNCFMRSFLTTILDLIYLYKH